MDKATVIISSIDSCEDLIENLDPISPLVLRALADDTSESPKNFLPYGRGSHQTEHSSGSTQVSTVTLGSTCIMSLSQVWLQSTLDHVSH